MGIAYKGRMKLGHNFSLSWILTKKQSQQSLWRTFSRWTRSLWANQPLIRSLSWTRRSPSPRRTNPSTSLSAIKWRMSWTKPDGEIAHHHADRRHEARPKFKQTSSRLLPSFSRQILPPVSWRKRIDQVCRMRSGLKRKTRNKNSLWWVRSRANRLSRQNGTLTASN